MICLVTPSTPASRWGQVWLLRGNTSWVTVFSSQLGIVVLAILIMY